MSDDLKDKKGERILVVEDDDVLNEMVVGELRRIGYATTGAATWAAAEEYLSVQEPQLVLLDPRLPDRDANELLQQLASQQPVIVLTAFASVPGAVAAMKAGVADYLAKPLSLDELEFVVDRVLRTERLRREHEFLKSQQQSRRKKFILGQSQVIRDLDRLIDAVAPSDATVLIQGESGVGKELVAIELHERSLRRDSNFVALDCCTLQETLFESELFGHERGSFTGADRQKKGLIENAEGGTLFLDEIGNISPTIQAKLLRFLESGEFRRLGGTKDLRADVRIVAATNADLEALCSDGTFRPDLYYRLNAFGIHVPPLREHREDIPALVDHFMRNHSFSRRVDKVVAPAAMRVLVHYDWPGNVRELRNVVERAIILSGQGRQIRREHFAITRNGSDLAHKTTLMFDHEPTLKEIEGSYLRLLLDRYAGHRARVAQALGVSERNTYRLIQKYFDHREREHDRQAGE